MNSTRARWLILGIVMAGVTVANFLLAQSYNSPLPELSPQAKQVVKVLGFKDAIATRSKLRLEISQRDEVIREQRDEIERLLTAVIEGEIEPKVVTVTKVERVPVHGAPLPPRVVRDTVHVPMGCDPSNVTVEGMCRVEVLGDDASEDHASRMIWSSVTTWDAGGESWSASRGPEVVDTVSFMTQSAPDPLWPWLELRTLVDTDQGFTIGGTYYPWRKGRLLRHVGFTANYTSSEVVETFFDGGSSFDSSVYRQSRGAVGVAVRF